MPLVWMTVLSPVFLPGFNLMLDVPAMALSLAALSLFITACQRDSLKVAALPATLVFAAFQLLVALRYLPVHGRFRSLAFGTQSAVIPGGRQFAAPDRDLFRGFDPQPDRLAPDFQDGHRDPITDHDALVFLAGKDKHVGPP